MGTGQMDPRTNGSHDKFCPRIFGPICPGPIWLGPICPETRTKSGRVKTQLKVLFRVTEDLKRRKLQNNCKAKNVDFSTIANIMLLFFFFNFEPGFTRIEVFIQIIVVIVAHCTG